jgi:hypothetical protein
VTRQAHPSSLSLIVEENITSIPHILDLVKPWIGHKLISVIEQEAY